jgi:cell division protein FtsQ
MVWRRLKRSEPADPESADIGSHEAGDAPSGDLDPLLHDLVADEVVLVELSKAFAEPELDAPADIPPDTSPADTPPADTPPARKTIIIGGGDLPAADLGGESDFDAVGPDDGVDRPGGRVVGLAGAGDDGSARNTIAIGGSEDLPDAVYLDDELERDPSGSGPVFIDDDGRTDAVLPQQAAGHGIEPRIRERRIGVRRAESRRRLWWLALGGAVLVVVIAALALLGSSLFAVDEVTVTGNLYTDDAALAAIVDDLKGTPVLRVDAAEFEARLEELAWVDRARVRTDFPDAATVEIVERTPVAAMQGVDGRTRVLDDEGRVLAIVEGQPVDLVWFAGTGTLDAEPGQFAPPGPSSAASLVTKLTPNIASRVEYLLVTPDGGDLVLLLSDDRGPIEVRFGSAIGDDAQIEKLVRLERTLDDSADRPVAVIDVSTSEVTVR